MILRRVLTVLFLLGIAVACGVIGTAVANFVKEIVRKF